VLAKLCRDVPPERLYDKKEKGGYIRGFGITQNLSDASG